MIEDHGFTNICRVDNAFLKGDMVLPVNRGKRLNEDYVRFLPTDYDSVPILLHFREHAMAGPGGALKNMFR